MVAGILKGADTMTLITIAAMLTAFVSMFAAILLGGSTPIIVMACAMGVAWAATKAIEKRDQKAAAKWKPVEFVKVY